MIIKIVIAVEMMTARVSAISQSKSQGISISTLSAAKCCLDVIRKQADINFHMAFVCHYKPTSHSSNLKPHAVALKRRQPRLLKRGFDRGRIRKRSVRVCTTCDCRSPYPRGGLIVSIGLCE